MAVVYKLTRSDGLEYVGITTDFSRRLKTHLKSSRFDTGIVKHEVLFEAEYDLCEDAEPIYIKMFDTYKNGLNTTPTGKGNHSSDCKFNTLGYKFSLESRKMMSEAKKGYVPWSKGKKGHFQPSEKWREAHTYIGSDNPRAILNEETVRCIIKEYNSEVPLEGVGVIMKNGKRMSYRQAFCKQKANKYGVSSAVLSRLLTKKTWKHVWEEFKI